MSIRFPRRSLPLVAAVLVAMPLTLAATAGAAGPNLVPNGDFAQGTTHWQMEDPSVGHLSVDRFGRGIVTMTSDNVMGVAESDCFPVAPSTQYQFQAGISVDVNSQGATDIGMRFYSDAQCKSDDVASMYGAWWDGQAPYTFETWHATYLTSPTVHFARAVYLVNSPYHLIPPPRLIDNVSLVEKPYVLTVPGGVGGVTVPPVLQFPGYFPPGPYFGGH